MGRCEERHENFRFGIFLYLQESVAGTLRRRIELENELKLYDSSLSFERKKARENAFSRFFFLKTHRMKNSFFIYHVGEWEEGERDFISSIRRRRRRLVEFREAGQTGRNGDRAEAATPTSTSKATTSPINFFLLSAKKR